MKIRMSSLCFHNVAFIRMPSSEKEWKKDILGVKSFFTREMVCPTGPIFFTIDREVNSEGKRMYTFYAPLSVKLDFEGDENNGFIEEFNIKKAVCTRQYDFDIKRDYYYSAIMASSLENKLKPSEKFYHVYLENYGVEALDIYSQVFKE
ncbi:MAG: hypothetical protein ACRC7N_16730 [Clostridium sp.]